MEVSGVGSSWLVLLHLPFNFEPWIREKKTHWICLLQASERNTKKLHNYENLHSCGVCVCERVCVHLSSGRLGEETLWSPELRGQVQVFPAPSIPPALLRSGEMDRIRERREGMGRRGHEPEVIDWRWRWGTVGTDIMDKKQFTFAFRSQSVWLLRAGLVLCLLSGCDSVLESLNLTCQFWRCILLIVKDAASILIMFSRAFKKNVLNICICAL